MERRRSRREAQPPSPIWFLWCLKVFDSEENTNSFDSVTPSEQNYSSLSSVDPNLNLSSKVEHTQGGDQDATTEDPPAAAPRCTPRGRTRASCETSVVAGNPRPVVELLDGNPVGPNSKISRAPFFLGLRPPTVLSQGVTGYAKLSYHELCIFWKRVKDCFEFVEVVIDKGRMVIVPLPPPLPAPALTPTSIPNGSSTRDLGTSSVASTPTQGPAHPDPMDCLILNENAKTGLKNLIAARYNGHR